MRPIPPRALWAALLMALACATASAARSDYQCDGGSTLTADFSPRSAQVRYEGEHWTLQRVRESREARYVSGRSGVSIVLLKNQATLARKGQAPVACKLVVRALRPEALGVAPAPASTPAR